MNGKNQHPNPPEPGMILVDGQPRKRYLYAVPDVAALLGGITERYVRMLIDGGKLRSVKLGRRVFVPHDALKEFLARHNVPVEDNPADHTAPTQAA